MGGDVAQSRRDGAPLRIVRHRARVPAPGGPLQGFSADETVRPEAPAPPAGARSEAPRSPSLRHLGALPRGLCKQLTGGFDAPRLTRGEVHDLQFHRIELECGLRTQRIQRDLQVARPAPKGPAGLVVDDAPAVGRSIDAVDDAVKSPAIDCDRERLLEMLRPGLEATLLPERFQLGSSVALECRFATGIGKRDFTADLAVQRSQHLRCDVAAVASCLAGAPQRLVHDYALDRLGALDRGQALDVPVPVLARTIAIREIG